MPAAPWRLISPGMISGSTPRVSSASRTTSSASITGSVVPSVGCDDSQPGVRVEPGCTTRTSTPCGASSIHSASPSTSANAFEAAYIASCADPTLPDIDDISTIPPRPRATIAGASARASCTGARQFTASMASRCAGASSRNGATVPNAAL